VQRVDGYGDDFCGVPALPFDPAKWQPVSLLDSVGPTPSFPGSTLQVAWTGGQDGALHVYAHIAKWPAVPQPADAGIFWGDAVEILVSTSAANLTGQTGGDKGAGHVLVAPIPPDSAQFFPANSGTSGETLARAEYATRLEPGVGYDVEVQIPWATLDASAPSPGSAIGFDAVVDIRVATEDGGDDWWQVALIVEALPVGVPPGGCGATNPSYQPYCDDRTWCTPVVQ
jgi:hypothetical protein